MDEVAVQGLDNSIVFMFAFTAVQQLTSLVTTTECVQQEYETSIQVIIVSRFGCVLTPPQLFWVDLFNQEIGSRELR